MPQPKNLNLRICDDVRQSPRGPLIGRVMFNTDPSDFFYISVPFSEAPPQAFSTRLDARDYVERRGKPVMDTSPNDSADTSEGQSPAA